MNIINFNKRPRWGGRSGIRRRFDVAEMLTAAGIVVAVLSALVWLIQDAKDLSESFGPTEGSLIVNINTATTEELVSVPGIGPTRAAQVVAGRPYATVDDLDKIAGIGGKTLESLRPFVTVEGDTRPSE